MLAWMTQRWRHSDPNLHAELNRLDGQASRNITVHLLLRGRCEWISRHPGGRVELWLTSSFRGSSVGQRKEWKSCG